ncbi:hypothetical protein BDR26DRAFT_522073 [Obelidium mucronatum]|nr:hypothetical protein BDR26DRAFT_522073 [Obelidium mucronatum]
MINIVNPSYGVILAALTYIDRYFNSKTRFNEKDTLIHYRLILGAFLCAYKYVNERSVKNTAWIRASSETFNLTEINIIERKFLACLQYDLVVEDMSTQESWLVTVRDVLELGTPLMKKNASLAADTPRSVSTTGTPSLKTSASPRTSVISTTSIALFQKVESARRKSWKGFLKLFSKGAKDSDKTEKDGEKEKGGQKKL